MSHEPATAPIERFKPTGGRLLGIVGLVILALLAIAFVSGGWDLQAALGVAAVAFLAVLVVAALVRPVIRAYPDHLLLRNAWTDVRLAWHGIEDVDVRQTLRVFVDGKRYHGVAIGKSTRGLLKGTMDRQPGRVSAFGGSRHEDLASQATLTGAHVTAMSYADYVVVKVQTYAAAQAPASRDRTPVDRSLTWLTIVPAVALLVLVVVLALVV